MKAIGFYIVIDEIKEAVKKTEGGLMLTDVHTNDIRYVKADVISSGNAVKGVEEGDVILYDKHAGHGLEVDNKFYKVIQERDVVLVL